MKDMSPKELEDFYQQEQEWFLKDHMDIEEFITTEQDLNLDIELNIELENFEPDLDDTPIVIESD